MHGFCVTAILVVFGMFADMGYAQDSPDDSPQLAFESYRTAFDRDDWRSLYTVISPGYKDYMIFEFVFSLGMDATKEAKAITSKYVDQANLEKLYKGFRQKPTTVQIYALYSQSIKNKKGMFFESTNYLTRKAKQDPNRNKSKYGPLMELVINKDVAFAKTAVTSNIVSWHNAGGDAKDIRQEQEITSVIPVYFIKSGGKWLFATPDEWKKHNTKDDTK